MSILIEVSDIKDLEVCKNCHIVINIQEEDIKGKEYDYFWNCPVCKKRNTYHIEKK